MHIEFTVASIAFHFVLTSLLVYFLWSLIKQHLIPFLYQKIIAFRKRRIELIEKQKLLASTLNRIDNQIKHQKKMFILLEKKIQLWHTTMKEIKRKKEKENKALLDGIKVKRALQEKSFTNTKLMREILPKAFASAEKKLHTKYSEQEGKTKLQELIFSLDKTEQ